MRFSNRVCQSLHEEHEAAIALTNRLDSLVAHCSEGAPDPDDANAALILKETSVAIQGEIESHFAFEEEHLFAYLMTIGEPGICGLLTDEHEVLRPLGMALASVAQASRERPLTPDEWTKFRETARTFSDGIRAHIEKEESGLIPLLEENMDGATEARLHDLHVNI